MKNKDELLTEIRDGLNAGVLTENDLRSLYTTEPAPQLPATDKPENETEKLSAVDVMFYIAGLVFFSTIMSIIAQSWDNDSAFVHIILSSGIGIILWTIAYYLIMNSLQNDVRKGLTNTLLLTGSLLTIVGGYILTNSLIGGFEEVNYIPAAFTLVVLGALHIGFDRLIKKDLTLLTGVVLCVAAFPALLFGILEDTGVAIDVWCLIMIFSVALLAYATRVVAKIKPDRENIRSSFDSIATFTALLSMYVANFGDYGVLWLGILIASVFGIFYLSIISQNKHLLGNASFFLVLTVITVSFKYFSGFGATASLIVATIGLLGSAAVASSINKKYFKQPK